MNIIIVPKERSIYSDGTNNYFVTESGFDEDGLWIEIINLYSERKSILNEKDRVDFINSLKLIKKPEPKLSIGEHIVYNTSNFGNCNVYYEMIGDLKYWGTSPYSIGQIRRMLNRNG